MIDTTKSYLATRTEIPFGDREVPNNAFSYYGILSEINLPIATKIGKTAFIGCDGIKTLELPRVTVVEDGAFQFCSGITSIDIPLATTIGAKSFAGCTSLVSVNLPALTTAGIAAFRNCTSLTTIDLTRLVEFNNNLLQNCQNLVEFKAPNVTQLGKNVFRGCSAIKDIILPKVTSVGQVPFHGCYQLESIELPSLTDFPNGIVGSWDSVLPALKYINLKSATKLYESFFQGAENLKCVNLSGFQYGLVNAARSDWRLPDDCDVLCSGGWIETRKSSISSLLNNDGAVLPEGGVAQRQFFKTSGLKSTVTSTNIDLYDPLIGEVLANAFTNKTNLAKVYFPIAWKIGANAFKGCSNIRQIRLPSLSVVGNVGSAAFSNCTKLKYLDLESFSTETVTEKKSTWGIPTGCTVLCSNGTMVA